MNKASKPTKHQVDVITRMRKAGRLVYECGFWTTLDMPWTSGGAFPAPEWSAEIAALKAMAARGWIVKENASKDYKAPWILSGTAPTGETT